MKRLSLFALALGIAGVAGCSSPQPPAQTVANPVPVAGAPAASGAPPAVPGGVPVTVNMGAPATPAAMGPNGMPPAAPPR